MQIYFPLLVTSVFGSKSHLQHIQNKRLKIMHYIYNTIISYTKKLDTFMHASCVCEVVERNYW